MKKHLFIILAALTCMGTMAQNFSEEYYYYLYSPYFDGKYAASDTNGKNVVPADKIDGNGRFLRDSTSWEAKKYM